MKRTRTTGITAIAGLMLAAAAAAPAQADGQAAQWRSTGGGGVVYGATYNGKISGLQGNRHDIHIESGGDMNTIVSSYCPPWTGKCIERSHRRINPTTSPVDFWVSSTGKSAKVTGTVNTRTDAGWAPRSLPVDLTLYATDKPVDGQMKIRKATGHLGWNYAEAFVVGFLAPR